MSDHPTPHSEPAEIVTARNVDLTNCDRELIQYSGAVQPHCVLLVLSEPDFRIVQASVNTDELLGKPLGSVLGQTLSAVLDSSEEAELLAKIAGPLPASPIHVLRTSRQGHNFHIFAHRVDGLLLLEWEKSPHATDLPQRDLYSEVRNTLASLQATQSLGDFFDLAVNKIQEFSGFDRVLAYQFLPDKSGKVIAEARQAGSETYLGQHYPASDIPQPARRMFSLLWLRHLPDVNYTPVPIRTEINPVTAGPLDLSLVAGRSVSVMYSKYLQNMGVRSTMVMTLLKDGKLWGLISCMHHSGPRHIPYDVRLACEFLGHMVSFLMAAKENELDASKIVELHKQVAQLVQQMSTEETFYQGLLRGQTNALSILGCGGVAVVRGPDIHTLGACPEAKQIDQISTWLDVSMDQTAVFATDRLSQQMVGAEEFKSVASGLLAIRISGSPRAFALWFRPEIAVSVLWAGDPSKPVEVEDVRGEARLTPRSSFAIWKEEVRGKSDSWAEYEIKIMGEFQRSIVDVIAKKSEQLLQLNRELQISNVELDSFAYAASHDLKEPLRGIHNFSALVLRKAGEALDEESRGRMQTIQRLTQRMDELIETLLHYSRVGRVQMAFDTTDLNQVLGDAREMLSSRFEETGAEIRLARPLPSVVCDPIRVREVFANLLSNALKFNDKAPKWVEVGWAEAAPPVFWVRDNGIGISADHHEEIFRIFRRLHGRDEMGGGSGAGLTIIRKIVERHGGKIWVESTPGAGTTFFFTLAAEAHVNARPAGGAE